MAAYCDAAGIRLVFGTKNVNKWADLDNDNNATTIANRIAWAAQRATDIIDDKLRQTHYDVPFDPVPQTIVDLARMLAGIILYETPRGLVDGDDSQVSYAVLKTEITETLQKIVAGQIKLDAEVTINNSPAVVV